MDDRNLRTEFHRAIDAVAPPAPWLGAAIREDLRTRRHESWADRARRTAPQTRFAIAGLAMAGLALLVGAALLLAQLYAPVPAPIPGGRSSLPTTPSLTATEQRQLPPLESRPLSLPAMPSSGQCPDGPTSTITPYKDGRSVQVWGTGSVFAEGGVVTLTPQFAYFDVTFYTAPSVTGVVLIRGQQLDGKLRAVYVGDYAAGSVVGTDTIAGTVVEQHAEAALPANRPPSVAGANPGWGIWKIRQGIDRSYVGCTGFQFDTANGTEVIVAYDTGAPGLHTTP